MDSSVKRIRSIDTRTAPTRMIPRVRVVVCAALLVVCLINEFAPNCFTVLLYSGYSATLYMISTCRRRWIRILSPWEHWIDLVWFAALALYAPTSHAFQLGLLFPVLVAAIRAGFRTALLVSVASAIVCAGVEVMGMSRAPGAHLRLPACAGIVLVLGYALARWGGLEIRLKRRLEFLAEASKISNPRLGAVHIFDSMMKRLRRLYDVEACLLVLKENGSQEATLRRSSHWEATRTTRPEPIPQELATLLLELTPGNGVVYSSPAARRWFGRGYYREYSMTEGKGSTQGRRPSQKIAAALEAESFVSVPVSFHDQILGRLFLTSTRRLRFEDSDMYFILQVIEQVMPIIDNARLVDKLVLDAGAEDRNKIARDLHDGVIQPYVGIRMGLDALRRKADAGNLESREIDRLIEISESGLSDLRGYVAALKDGGDNQDTDLPSTVRQFARRFGDATGINIKVEVENGFSLSGRMAAEAYLLIREGLSNIRRHSQSSSARVRLACPHGELELRIEDSGDTCRTKTFLPRSIAERAEALGGRSKVEAGPDGGCSVVVQVPL